MSDNYFYEKGKAAKEAGRDNPYSATRQTLTDVFGSSEDSQNIKDFNRGFEDAEDKTPLPSTDD